MSFTLTPEKIDDIFARSNQLNKARVWHQGTTYWVYRRSQMSQSSAIQAIAPHCAAQVHHVVGPYIVESYVAINQARLSLEEWGSFLERIHKYHPGYGILVHGDLGNHNITRINQRPCCFDLEHVHWGDPYVDLGRIILRECGNPEDLALLFTHYKRPLPSHEVLTQGLSVFCDFQYKLRTLKGAPFRHVPHVRKKRMHQTGKSLEHVLKAFLDPVVTDHASPKTNSEDIQ